MLGARWVGQGTAHTDYYSYPILSARRPHQKVDRTTTANLIVVEIGSSKISSCCCSISEGDLCIILERRLPNEPKLGRLCVRSDVRSCPTDRFRCSLGLKGNGNDSNVGAEGIVIDVDVEAATTSAGDVFAASGFSSNCRNLSK